MGIFSHANSEGQRGRLRIDHSDRPVGPINVLALPGIAVHKAQRHSPSYMSSKSRLFTYELLRAIANWEHKDKEWLSMIEEGAMMRYTANDKLLQQCTEIKLRLTQNKE